MNEAITPYMNQLYGEIKQDFPKHLVVDTYKNLLFINSFVKEDIGKLELLMCKYLIREK